MAAYLEIESILSLGNKFQMESLDMEGVEAQGNRAFEGESKTAFLSLLSGPLCFRDLFVPVLQGSSLGGIGCILEAPCSHRISRPKSCLSTTFRKPYFFSLRSVTSRKEGPSD